MRRKYVTQVKCVCICAIVGVMKFGVCVLKVNKRNTKKRKKSNKEFFTCKFQLKRGKADEI